MGMINRMGIRQLIADAGEAGADPLLLAICEELLDEIEHLEEKTIGVEG